MYSMWQNQDVLDVAKPGCLRSRVTGMSPIQGYRDVGYRDVINRDVGYRDVFAAFPPAQP
jgi:hypothetical protein